MPEIAGPVVMGAVVGALLGAPADTDSPSKLRLVLAVVLFVDPDGPRGGGYPRRIETMTIFTSDTPDRLNNRLAQLLGLGNWRRAGSSRPGWCCEC
jgi:hypothetical protein